MQTAMSGSPAGSPFQSFLSRLKSNAPWLGVIAVLGLLPFLGFLFSDKILFASDQIGSPSWKFVFECLRNGEIPLWNPFHIGGMPTYDSLVGDGSYPLFLFLGLFAPIERLVSFLFVLHTVLAGCFAYVLVRGHFRLDRLIATALATAYMLNTNFFSHIYSGHTGKFYVLTWLPLGLYFLLQSLEKGSAWWKPIGLALTVTMMVLTSHLQLTYYVLIGYFLFYAFRLGLELKAKAYASAGALSAKFWIAVLLGIGLCFPLLWAPVQYNKEFSVRGEGARQSYEHATSWSIHPEEAASLVVPEFGGMTQQYWGRNPFKLNSEYPGIAVWFLGVFGLIAFRRAFFWIWASIGLLAILYGLGANTPLFHLFYAIVPGIKNFRAPSMMLFWLATALLLMSAEALRLLTVERDHMALPEKAIEKNLGKWGWIAAGVIALMGLLSSVTYSIWNAFINPEAMQNFVHQTEAQGPFTVGAIRAGILIALLVFGVRTFLIRQRNERFFGALLLLATLGDLYWVNRHFIETYEFNKMFPDEPAIAALKSDTSSYRVFAMPGSVQRGYLQYHEIASTDGWADQEYRLYRSYRGGDYQQNPTFMAGLSQNPDGTVAGSRFLDMLNVKYLLFRTPQAPGVQMTANRSSLGQAWFTTEWKSLPGDDHMPAMQAPDFNPARLTLVDAAAGLGNREAPAPVAMPALPNSGDSATAAGQDSAPDSLAQATPVAPATPTASVQWAKEKSGVNASHYTATVDQEGIFVISEVWFPYWKVRVDGKDAPLLRVNHLFRGVHLTPGSHRIEMTYSSPSLQRGMLASLLAAICLLLFGAVLFLRRPKSASPAG